MPVQSKEEILRIFDEWGRHYAPSNFIQNEKNAALLADYVLKTYGIVSIIYLNEAANALTSQLDRVLEAKPETQEEIAADFQAKELKRIERERIENSKPFVHAEKIKEAQAAEAEAKRQATAQAQIDHLIHNFSVNAGPGRIDHAKSDLGRAALRGIKIHRNGKYDAVLTLRVLQQAHMSDDVPSIIRAAEKAKQGLVDAINAKPDRGPIR